MHKEWRFYFGINKCLIVFFYNAIADIFFLYSSEDTIQFNLEYTQTSSYQVTWARRRADWSPSPARGRWGCRLEWGTLGKREATGVMCPNLTDPGVLSLPLREMDSSQFNANGLKFKSVNISVVLTPIRYEHWAKRFTHQFFSVRLMCCCRLLSPPSPAVCTGWWHESSCRWPAGSPLWKDMRKSTLLF